MSNTHIAIMRKSWGLTNRILAGEKVIESRWYINRHKPWGQIEAGDTIYFKDSGEPIKLKATVDKVLQFDDLTPFKVKKILDKYSADDGIAKKNIKSYFEKFKNKKYCILVFLKDVKSVEPFRINKSGFGNMAAWLIVSDIEKIKIMLS